MSKKITGFYPFPTELFVTIFHSFETEIAIKAISLKQFPASNENKIILFMKNRRLQILII